MQRRSFIKNSSLAAAALGLGDALHTMGKASRKISVQLWSVREDMAHEAAATLSELAKFGYRNVEGFGLDSGKIFGMPVKQFRKLLDDNKLWMPSSHTGITPDLFDAKGKPNDLLKKRLDDAEALGIRYLIHPYLGNDERNADFLKKHCDRLNTAGAAAKDRGITVCYHNHDFEFTGKLPDGTMFYEMILKQTDPELVKMQLDLYWACFAGQQPADWFALHPDRFRLFHVKDMAKTEKRETVEVGDGSIDFQQIFDAAKPQHIKLYVVELEHYKTSPVAGVGRALAGLQKLKI